jgi:hypothetical protein
LAKRAWSVAAPGKLYAYWTEVFYQLTFDSRGGDGISAREATYGAAIGALPEPARKGYEFAAGGVRQTAERNIRRTPYTAATGNMQLYARWSMGGRGGPLIDGVADGIIIAAFCAVDLSLLSLLLVFLRRNKKKARAE